MRKLSLLIGLGTLLLMTGCSDGSGNPAPAVAQEDQDIAAQQERARKAVTVLLRNKDQAR